VTNQQRRVHENVFGAGELRIKAGTQFEQSRYSTLVPNFAVRRLESSRDYLQQRRLATTVWPDDSDDVALVKFKGNTVQRPEFFVSSQTAAGERFFQPITGPRIGSILLRDTMNSEGGRHAGNVSEFTS